MLVVDTAGVIRITNAAARSLPGISAGAAGDTDLSTAVPQWLAAAHREFVAAAAAPPPATAMARGAIGDRIFDAFASWHDDGRAQVTWWLTDVTKSECLSSTLRTERERAAFIAEASTELLSSLNLDRCIEVTARLAAWHLADAAFVITPRIGRRHRIAYGNRQGVVRRDLNIDPTELPGLAEALQGFPPVPSRWIDAAAAPGWLAAEQFGEIGEFGEIVVTALPGHGVPAGALVLLRRTGQAGFSESEEVFARLFAARAGAAISAARLYAEQSAITDTLMRELLPPRRMRLAAAELAARYRSAGDGEPVGGDFYDVHSADDPAAESLVVLGDVCGKGLEAAVLTGKIRNTVHALVSLADDHQRILGILNQVLLTADGNRFVTLVLASVCPAESGARVRLTSAGHLPPMIVRSNGRVEQAATQGSLIGVLDEIHSTTATVLLAPGETCLLYTDGITEALGGPRGDEMLGEQRLYEDLAQCAGIPPEALVERVQMLASEWAAGGERDDMAVVAISAQRHARPVPADGPR
jgi:serine phosphatase RsbU (regulator of sigma subunit)